MVSVAVPVHAVLSVISIVCADEKSYARNVHRWSVGRDLLLVCNAGREISHPAEQQQALQMVVQQRR